MDDVIRLLDEAVAGSEEGLGDRYLGTLLGCAAGNCLGLPVEGWSSDRIRRHHPNGLLEIDPKERNRPWDDDLAQTVVLADALLHTDGFSAERFAQALIQWRGENGRGIGVQTSRVIDLLAAGDPVHLASEKQWIGAKELFGEGSASNGAVMRCSPLALRWRRNPQRLIQDTRSSTLVTHYDERCFWTALAVNIAILHALYGTELRLTGLAKGMTAAGAPAGVTDAIISTDRAELENLQLDEWPAIGYTVRAMQAALWAMQQPAEFRTVVVALVNAGGDTDTNGAVVGAIMGARVGLQQLPVEWRDCVRDPHLLRERAHHLFQRSSEK